MDKIFQVCAIFIWENNYKKLEDKIERRMFVYNGR